MNKDTDKTKAQLLAELTAGQAELAELRKKSKEEEDKLNASNQQLDAYNQQLQATEQQLRAANQQLDANNQQLIASEKDLKKEKIFSEKIVETADAIIVGLDKDHIIRIFNQGAENITRYKKNEVIGKDWFKIFFPKEMLDEMNKVWKKGWGVKSHSYINLILAKSGEERIISWQTTGMYDSDDVSKHLLLSIGEDITDRKQAEEALRESKEQFRRFMNTSPSLTFIKDASLRYLFADKQTSDFFGKSINDILGKTDREIAGEEKIAPCPSSDKKALGSDTVITVEEKLGDQIYEVIKFPLTLPGGEKGIGGIMNDITERKQAEEKLKATNQQLDVNNQQLRAIEQQLRVANQQLTASEAKFKSYMQNAPDGIFIANEKGKYIGVNKAACEITGYSEDELLNLTISELIQEEYSEKAKNHFQTVIKEGFASGELGFVTKSGEKRFWRVDAVKFSETRFLGFAKNTTERKQAEEKLKQKNEQFETIIEGANLGWWDWDIPSGDEIYNDILTENLGYKLNEVEPHIKWWEGKIHSDDAKQVNADLQEHFDGKTVFYKNKHRLKTKTGQWKWFLDFGKVVERDDTGKVIRMIGTLRDIDEEVKAQEKIQSNLQQIEVINANTPNIVWKSDIDKQGNFINIYISEVADEFLALPKGTINNNWDKYFSYIIPDYLPQINEMFKKGIANPGEIISFSYEVKKADGKKAWFTSSGRLIVENNKLTGYGSTIDITERKQAEESLKESEMKFRNLAESTLMGIMLYQNDYWIYANSAAEEITGYTFGELKQMKFWEFIAPEYVDLIKKRGRARQKGKLAPSGYEFKIITKQGKEKWILLTGNTTELKSGKAGIITVFDITKRKLTENELSKLSTAVIQSPATIAITDKEGNLEYVNPQFIEITGYSQEEAIGQNPRVLKSGEQTDDMYKELWKTISSGKIWRGEFYNKKKNGELFWEMASVSPIFDEQGKIINYIKVAENITEQKRNEQIQSIIHNISNAVIASHSQGNFLTLVKEELGEIIDTTNCFVALYDEKTDSISLPLHYDEKDRMESYPAGKTLTNYVIKTGKPLLATKAVIAKLEKSGEVETIDHSSEVWLGVPLKSENKVTGIFAVQSYNNENAYNEADMKILEIISYQISLSLERLKAEEDLMLAKEKAEESEYKVRSMFENTHIGIFYCNVEGKILEANQMMLDILGSPSKDSTLEINILTFKPLQENGFAHNVEKCISEKNIVTEDTVYTTKWGKTIFMKYHLVPVILNNKVIGVWANLNNLTDLWSTQNQLKKAKEKAEESDHLKSAFLANMSHEIRTPMNGILGFAELLKEPQLTGDEKEQYIQVIERSGNRMLNTINDIIDISKIEAGQVEVSNTEVSANEILEDQYRFFYHETESKGL
ncbi:MAG: PAS domain S-box protein, partial [Bacteroidota bacterium]|nr:PAS domain S-box protein [Bacteroidota bacterium]